MPLNLSKNDGEFNPYIKYNAKAGRWYVRGVEGDEEVKDPRLVFDMANVKTGWLHYEEGSGPEKVWDPSPGVTAPRPAGAKKFKRGFEVMVFGPDKINGTSEKIGLREFSSTAQSCITAFLDMYHAYEQACKTNAGKFPMFKQTKVTPITGKYGTNYEPVFELVSWVEQAKVPELKVDKPIESEDPAAGLAADLDDEIPFEMSWK